jgi:hypothetical protein
MAERHETGRQVGSLAAFAEEHDLRVGVDHLPQLPGALVLEDESDLCVDPAVFRRIACV